MFFEIGKEYHRKSEIHGELGGQSQGGISTPKNHPVVLLFTSEAGEQHGYQDEYRDDGVFWYTGEGQVGDMKMIAGNKAILEHQQIGKTLHVFEYVRKATVRYMGSAECLGYHEEQRPDREGNEREVFVFHLDIDSVPAQDKVDDSVETPTLKQAMKSLKNRNLKDLRKAALAVNPKAKKPTQKRESAFIRSQAIKLYVIARAKGICEGCGNPAPFHTKTGAYLECHHLYRISDGGPDHPENVIAVCPNCHRRAHYSKEARAFNQTLIHAAQKAEHEAIKSS